MGTRSLTFVHEDDDPAIVCIYKQYDGYFDGVGDEILSFLKGTKIVNGIGMNSDREFNGSGDLAARLITKFKDGNPDDAGGVYIEPADLNDGDMGTEYAYHIHCTVGEPPYLVAKAVYSGFTVEGYVDDFVWPQQDEDGNYIAVAADTSGPLTGEQRKALFVNFRELFGADDDARYRFTRKALGKRNGEVVSWSADKPGALTQDEASRLLDVFAALGEVADF